MQFTKSQIEALLHQSEGEALDFKRDQYEFSDGNERKKSEILKDLLAFANSWRQTDAFILVGVKEEVGGKAIPVGISDYLQESNLQQFVSEKTNRPLKFEYHIVELGGVKIGVFWIPIQRRPIYSLINYGGVRKHEVYCRRGSSTFVANPEQVAEMGEARADSSQAEPTLDLEYGDPASGEFIGQTKDAYVSHLSLPEEIPDFGVYQVGAFSFGSSSNANYYRDFANYIRDTRRVSPLHFALVNRGSVTSHGTRLEVSLTRTDAGEELIDEGGLPIKPSSGLLRTNLAAVWSKSLIRVEAFPKCFRAHIDVGKLQPKESIVVPEPLLVGAGRSRQSSLSVKLFADNLSSPLTFDLVVNLHVHEGNLTVEGLLQQADNEADAQ